MYMYIWSPSLPSSLFVCLFLHFVSFFPVAERNGKMKERERERERERESRRGEGGEGNFINNNQEKCIMVI